MSKILVTGGSGMIGRKVMELLPDAFNADLPDYDLRDFNLCKELTKGVDYLYHIAGVKGSGKMTKERPADFFVPIIQMNTNILEAARLNNVKKILYVSSTAVTHDEYPGWAKQTGEKQLESYKEQYGFDNWVVIRPNSVYGEGDNFDPDDGMFIPSLMAKIKRGDDPVVLFGDKDVRDFIYSGDVAEVLIRAMESLVGLYELGSPRMYETREVVQTLQGIVDFRVQYNRNGSTKRVVKSHDIYHLLGYIPQVSLREGLEKTWKYYQPH